MKNSIDQNTQQQIEAAVFRRLIRHFQSHTDVQNIELMVLADFCRNCLAKWYKGAAEEQGIELDYEAAREIVYGMPYQEWKEKYQSEATPDQLQRYQDAQKKKPRRLG